MKEFILVITLLFSSAILTAVTVKRINLKQNCTGYLERAANSNTVEIAMIELEKAIKYLEENNLTTGYTSIFYRTPDEDIGFWYNNLKSSYEELSKVDSNTTALEKSNLLMKLRETLMNGSYIEVPTGLSRYPNNALWMVLTTIAVISLFIFIVVISVVLDLN